MASFFKDIFSKYESTTEVTQGLRNLSDTSRTLRQGNRRSSVESSLQASGFSGGESGVLSALATQAHLENEEVRLNRRLQRIRQDNERKKERKRFAFGILSSAIQASTGLI